ncbi:MAG: protein translocase subunit SecF [Parvularcula sp.]
MGLQLIPDDTHIPFTSYRWFGVTLSSLAVVGSILAIMFIGLNLGIDFRGGITVEVGPAPDQTFTQDDLEPVRSAIAAANVGNFKVQTIGSPGGGKDNIVVFVERQEADLGGLTGEALHDATRDAELAQTAAKETVINALRDTLGENIDLRREDVVGPTVSGELIQKGVTALVIAIGMMLVYIAFRFEWQFSLGAVAALVHDVIVTMGFFAVTHMEFGLSIVAALLTIVGYSMNDTVVIYDRVRENLRRYKKKDLAEVVDLSVNQTLSRTLMTSLTTLIALVALLFLGGSVLRGFSMALIWGIVIGTYSTVFVASPSLLWTGVRRDAGEQKGNSGAVSPA